MKALKKNVENLKKVVDSICEINFTTGLFRLDFATDDSAVLVSDGRNHIGSTIISLIPSNWVWSAVFRDGIFRLYIWF